MILPALWVVDRQADLSGIAVILSFRTWPKTAPYLIRGNPVFILCRKLDTSRSLVDPTWESLRQDLSAYGWPPWPLDSVPNGVAARRGLAPTSRVDSTKENFFYKTAVFRPAYDPLSLPLKKVGKERCPCDCFFSGLLQSCSVKLFKLPPPLCFAPRNLKAISGTKSRKCKAFHGANRSSGGQTRIIF